MNFPAVCAVAGEREKLSAAADVKTVSKAARRVKGIQVSPGGMTGVADHRNGAVLNEPGDIPNRFI
jgi:hypothetical protein